MGDQVLCIGADVIKNCIRKTDKLIRYGGDEFLLVVPNVKEDEFLKELQQIRDKFMMQKFQSMHNFSFLSALAVYFQMMRQLKVPFVVQTV